MKLKYEYSIALIVCYIGKLPWYFDYFAHTCKFNPSITFLIITDDTEYSKSLPFNVKLIYKTLNEIKDLAYEKLGFSIQISNAYKLCDFKPVFGVMFEEYLEKFDFWGHGDIDLIFGDIRSFINSEVLKNHDIISVRHDFLSGYFLLYRNNIQMKKLFTLSKDYIKVLTSDKHFCFDETNHAHAAFGKALESGFPQFKIITEIESMTHLVCRLASENLIKPYFELHVVEGHTGRVKWENGKLYYKNKYEILLYHMILFKKRYTKAHVRHISNSFRISPNRIY